MTSEEAIDKLVRMHERRRVAVQTAKKREAEAREQLAREELLSKVILLLRHASQTAVSYITERIDPLGQRALQELFGPSARFETSFHITERGQSRAQIRTGVGDQVGNPLATDGNSVAEIVSDAVLRPIVVALHVPRLAPLVLLDEPFAGVDAERVHLLGAFLKDLCETTGTQFVLTTHEMSRAFDEYADEVIELR